LLKQSFCDSNLHQEIFDLKFEFQKLLSAMTQKVRVKTQSYDEERAQANNKKTSASVNAAPESILNHTSFTISSTSEKVDHTMHESSENK
jgi:hypothetical protein